MSASVTNLHPLASAAAEGSQAAQRPPADSADERKLKKAAADFESILLSSLWKSMKQSFGTSDDQDSSDPAKGTLDDWGTEIMSGAVGRAGGLGLGKMILKQLEPALHTSPASSEPTSPLSSQPTENREDANGGQRKIAAGQGAAPSGTTF